MYLNTCVMLIALKKKESLQNLFKNFLTIRIRLPIHFPLCVQHFQNFVKHIVLVWLNAILYFMISDIISMSLKLHTPQINF